MAVSDYVFRLRETLAKYEKLRDEILSNGQNHSLTGSHAVEYPNLKYVEKQIQRVQGDLVRANGGKAHTYPTYVATSTVSSETT